MVLPTTKPLKREDWLAQQMVSSSAGLARAAYIHQRTMWGYRKNDQTKYKPGPRWDGGSHRGRNYVCVWEKVAAFQLKHHLNPYLHTRAVFDLAADSSKAPLPNVLLTQYSVDAHNEAKRAAEKDVAAIFLSNSTFMKGKLHYWMSGFGMSEADAALEIVTNPQSDISDLFRYCAAYHKGFHTLAQDYAPAAVTQIIGLEEIYLRHWGSFVPPEIVDIVQKAYDQRRVME